MNKHIPDSWRIIKITNEKGEFHYRIIGSWQGGFADPDFWRISSGCITFEKETKVFKSLQDSGSVYVLDILKERNSGLISSCFNKLKSQSEGLDSLVEYIASEEILKQFKEENNE